MSRKKFKKLDDPRDRILYVIENEFESEADFCREADLSHNWVQYFKKAKERPGVNDHLLGVLYELKKISPLWIINEEGPYKIVEEFKQGMAAEDETKYLTDHAFVLLERIEQQVSASKDIQLPEGIELVIVRLLSRILERRYEDRNR